MKKVVLAMLLVTISASPGIKIPDDVMKSSFGKAHTFMLKVHGPNPVFTRAGYSFRVETYGYELSDKYYYEVPVYVDFDPLNKMYRLYSTREGVSVEVTVFATQPKDYYIPPATSY